MRDHHRIQREFRASAQVDNVEGIIFPSVEARLEEDYCVRVKPECTGVVNLGRSIIQCLAKLR